MDEIKKNFVKFAFEINKSKSITNSPACEADAMLIKGTKGYKCLKVIENCKNENTGETAEKIRTELLVKV
ncbi:hypothetical protein NUSPORA_00719 [Nucleospora cyclopteri]